MVDSSDRARMAEAKAALRKILGEEKLRGVPLMVLANKKDLPSAMSIHEVGTTPVLPVQEGQTGLKPESLDYKLGFALTK